MRHNLFSGIFGHFFLRVSLTQTLIGVLLLSVVLPVFNHFSDKMAVEQGRTFANSTLAATIDALYKDDYGQIVDYCMGVMKNTPNVEYINFVNQSGEELAITKNSWQLKNASSAPGKALREDSVTIRPAQEAASGILQQLYFLPQKSFEFERPIIISGKEWGSVRIGFSKAAYYDSIHSFYWTVSLLTLTSLLLSLFLFLISSARIRRQIDTFAGVAGQLAEGELNVTASEKAIGEIGVLGKAINKMSSMLRARIRERDLAEQELKIAATAFESQEGILVTDAHVKTLRVNQAFTNVTGYEAMDVIGQNPSMLSSGRHDAAFYEAMWESINTQGAWEGEIWNRRKNGEIYPQHVNITAVRNADGVITNYVASMMDITQSKAAAAKIEQLAFYDPLTNLPNRRLLLDRLQQAQAASTRSGKMGALLFLDLDNFKTLNDTLGHDTGDELLRQVGSRLTACVRREDTVSRLGGDEFVVMLEDLSETPMEAASQVEIIGHNILTALNKPYKLGTNSHSSTPSIGITLFKGLEQGIDELLKQADIAMYQAKKSGRNAMRFFDPKMQASIDSRAALEADLRLAITKGQLRLHYQIQVNGNGKVFGAEGLIRWAHPTLGMLLPNQFIPLAEETGLINPIGQWVLETACAQLAAWQQSPITRHLSLSLNVSPKQFHQLNFAERVRAALQANMIEPSLLKLELTESILLEDMEGTIEIMNALSDLGVGFSLDDFGTGYSSLQYLKRLPLTQLKIDKSFVHDISTNQNDRAIVSTIIAMAKGMQIGVIAEGVESEEQRELLMESGCHQFQGYLFGKPVNIQQLEEFITQTNDESVC